MTKFKALTYVLATCFFGVGSGALAQDRMFERTIDDSFQPGQGTWSSGLSGINWSRSVYLNDDGNIVVCGAVSFFGKSRPSTDVMRASQLWVDRRLVLENFIYFPIYRDGTKFKGQKAMCFDTRKPASPDAKVRFDVSKNSF